MKYVMFYEAAPDGLAKAPLHFAGHRARLDEFHGRGTLLLAGPLLDPMDGGAIGVFTTREAAEEFIHDDPFVLHGVVGKWTIRGWNEVLG